MWRSSLNWRSAACALIFQAAAVLSPAAEAPPPPISAKPGATLQSDHRQLFRAWCERVLVEPARQRLAGSQFETEAVKFIDAAMEEYIAEDPCSRPYKLKQAGDTLARQ